MKQNNEIKESIDFIEFTNKLKNKDDSYANLSKLLQTIYWVLIPIYLILVIRHIFDKSPVVDILGSICFMFAMLIFALLFRQYYKEYKFVDYSQPTLVMLKKAAYRYKPFQLKTLWAILGVLLIDVGLSLNTSLGFEIIWIQILFLGAIAIAALIGLLIWKVRYKYLRDAALFLIREIEGEN